MWKEYVVDCRQEEVIKVLNDLYSKGIKPEHIQIISTPMNDTIFYFKEK